MHTHLHADHVGWDTHRDGDDWVPTFTGARHLYTEAELEFVAHDRARRAKTSTATRSRRSSTPGLADIVEPDADLGHGMRLEATPGHTPGHTSLWIESDGEHALITGDFMHHPFQFAEPQLAEIADADVEVARATRAPDARARWRAPARSCSARTSRPVPPVASSTDGDAWRFVAGVDGAVVQSIRCMSTTSSQRPNLRPTSRSQPISSKPHLRCRAIDASWPPTIRAITEWKP